MPNLTVDSKHTPGPWTEQVAIPRLIAVKGHAICTMTAYNPNRVEDTHLIEAAPLMHEALTEILRHIHEEPADMAYINNTAVNALAAANGEGS